MKLATIVPPSFRKQIQGTLDFIAQHPKDERNTNNLNLNFGTRYYLSSLEISK
jgi:hypothetical protein